MSRKRIIAWTVPVATAALGVTVWILLCYAPAYREAQRLARPPIFTEFKLDRHEMDVLVDEYRLASSPDYHTPLNMEQWPNFGYYTLSSGEDSEAATYALSCILFEYGGKGRTESTGPTEAAVLAEDYGFSADSPITPTWVLRHPKEAVRIMDAADAEEFFLDEKEIFRLWNLHEVYSGIRDTEKETSVQAADKNASRPDRTGSAGANLLCVATTSITHD